MFITQVREGNLERIIQKVCVGVTVSLTFWALKGLRFSLCSVANSVGEIVLCTSYEVVFCVKTLVFCTLVKLTVCVWFTFVESLLTLSSVSVAMLLSIHHLGTV